MGPEFDAIQLQSLHPQATNVSFSSQTSALIIAKDTTGFGILPTFQKRFVLEVIVIKTIHMASLSS